MEKLVHQIFLPLMLLPSHLQLWRKAIKNKKKILLIQMMLKKACSPNIKKNLKQWQRGRYSNISRCCIKQREKHQNFLKIQALHYQIYLEAIAVSYVKLHLPRYSVKFAKKSSIKNVSKTCLSSNCFTVKKQTETQIWDMISQANTTSKYQNASFAKQECILVKNAKEVAGLGKTW